eukprot:TRINITY_DN1054_c0_g2_i1.p1 TRINITY_DN1054_c0_g2~~TRINITY_DN1054_c0_g2_i1.p1  ORF type:complete len:358 (+),score=158.67 TRINITY_DN1054_c0_g2_i1:103-1176(+)
MSLEATYIIIDSSEYMRNGDFSPNRFDAQIETINLLANAKTSSHPESTIGLMTMSGKRPEVLVTLGNDPTAVQTCIANLEVRGKSDLLSAISVTQLALKHRKNKNGGQRIVLFVGSPIEGNETVESFEKLGQRLKKNNISMDIVGFMGLGDDEKSNREKLTALYNGINKQDTSNLILLEPSSQIVADTLLSGPLFGNNGGVGDENGGGEILDEYQLAIKLSLQEAQDEEKKRIEQTLGTSSNTSTSTQDNNKMEDEDELDEETRKAIAMSMQMEQEENNNMDDEEESARQLSMDLTNEVSNEKKEISEALKDVSVDDLFGNLPGVTTDSEQIQNALKNIKGEEKDQNNNNNQDKKDK